MRREWPLLRRSVILASTFAVGDVTALGPRLADAGQAGAPQTDSRFEELATLVTEKMHDYRIPGVAFGVIKDGRMLTRGFGVTNEEDPQPVTPETIFPIASISKTVAATAIMRLLEAGSIDLHVPVRRYLREFRVRDEAATREVTLWHLLTHTPGWEGQLPTEDRGTQSLAYRTETLRDVPQLAAPGAVWSYNNVGFGVAGRVIEVVTGQSIHEALRDLVFVPLGLSRTFTEMGDVVTYRFAVGHRGEPTGPPSQVVRPFELATPNVTAGGVAMSVSDVLLFAQFHLDGRTRTAKPVLSRASLERMRTAQLRKSPTDDEMGIGWHLRRWNGVLSVAHGGTDVGHVALVEMVPERKFVLAILTNHAAGWRLIQDVERAALGLYEGLALNPNQAISNRGVSEALTDHVSPLPTQPSAEPYVGTYRRPPRGVVQVREEQGTVVVATADRAGTPIVFYGPDLAFAPANGSPYEFIRTSDGHVGWIRVNGRIAKKDTSR